MRDRLSNFFFSKVRSEGAVLFWEATADVASKTDSGGNNLWARNDGDGLRHRRITFMATWPAIALGGVPCLVSRERATILPILAKGPSSRSKLFMLGPN